MKKKNNMVELCRFLACYVIFSYHAGGRFTTGWIFVEFFFMLSGYFAIKHLVRMEGKIENKATYPIQYTIDKFKRLLPYTTVGCGRLLNFCLEISVYRHGTCEMDPVSAGKSVLSGRNRYDAGGCSYFRHGTDFLYHGWCSVVYLCDVCGNASDDVSVSVPGKEDWSVAYQFSADAAIWIPDYL